MRTGSLPPSICSLAVLLTIHLAQTSLFAEGSSPEQHRAAEHDGKKNEPSRDGDKGTGRRDCKAPPATATSFWALDGNAGTSPTNGNFLGTTDDQPLEIKVNGLRAMRYENGGVSSYELSFGRTNSNGSPNLIGGSPVNFVSPGVVGAVIDGGGTTNYAGFGGTNSVSADFGVIGGGVQNQIFPTAFSSVIGGGNYNQIQTNAEVSTIAGGAVNQIQYNAYSSLIGGGIYNQIGVNAWESTVGGGDYNQILSGAAGSTIAGGDRNQIQTNAFDSAIGGGFGNQIGTGASSSTIAGGGGNQIKAFYSAIAGGSDNQIQTDAGFSMIGGGTENEIQTAAGGSVIAGGFSNGIQTNAYTSVIGGGQDNQIEAFSSAILGGEGNQIETGANFSVISGGLGNDIQPNSVGSVIGGGGNNSILGEFAIIPGGDQNVATNNSLAGGHRAKATHQGAFVWADSTDADFSDAGSNTFNVRSSGGVVFASGTGGVNQMVSWMPGSGAWSFTSDRNAKENFQPVNARQILEKVAGLPLTEWNYKGYGDRHVGSMAQDFHAAFPFNANDKMLNSADEAGVSLAAIQGLNEKLDEKDAEIQNLKKQNDSLAERLNELETTVKQLASKK